MPSLIHFGLLTRRPRLPRKGLVARSSSSSRAMPAPNNQFRAIAKAMAASPDGNNGSGFSWKNQFKTPTLLIDNDPRMRNVSRQRILCSVLHVGVEYSFPFVVEPK